MKNSHPLTLPHHSPSFLSDSPVNPEPPPEISDAPPNDQLNTVQDLYDGLLHYVSCTTDDIVEIANKIQENCSTAKLLLENLKSEGLLDRKINCLDPENHNFLKLFIPEKSEKSPLGKRPNPYLQELDKETLIQANVDIEDLEAEPILEEFDDVLSENISENDTVETEDYEADVSVTTETIPKTYEDKQIQTSPIHQTPPQSHFAGGPLQYFPINFALPSFSLPENFDLPVNTIQDQNVNEGNEEEAQKNEDYPPIMQQRPMILVQPVYLLQPMQILNYLPSTFPSANEPTSQ
jgi:hypothetical protein